MLDANLIMHASQSEAQCFVDGMFLFFVKSTEKADGKENFVYTSLCHFALDSRHSPSYRNNNNNNNSSNNNNTNNNNNMFYFYANCFSVHQSINSDNYEYAISECESEGEVAVFSAKILPPITL